MSAGDVAGDVGAGCGDGVAAGAYELGAPSWGLGRFEALGESVLGGPSKGASGPLG